VSASDRGRNHRPPTSGRRIGDDDAAIGNRPEHGDRRVKQTVRQFIDENGSLRRP
jgi:hypothetical protein